MFKYIILIFLCANLFLSCNGDKPPATSLDIRQSQPMDPHVTGADRGNGLRETDTANQEAHEVDTENRQLSGSDSGETPPSEDVLGRSRCEIHTGLVRMGSTSDRTVNSMIQCARKLDTIFRKKCIHEQRYNCTKSELQKTANHVVVRLVYLGKINCSHDEWNQQLMIEAVRDQDNVCGLLLTSRGHDGLIDTMDDILYFSSFGESMSALLIDCLDDKQKKTCASLATCRAEAEHEGTSCPDYCTDFYGRKLHCSRSASARWRCISAGDDGEVGTFDDIDDIQ